MTTDKNSDLTKTVTAARELPLVGARLPDEYYYAHLPLCAVDAVFSIGVRYEGVENVVRRWCKQQTPCWRRHREYGSEFPGTDEQKTMSAFVELLNGYEPGDDLAVRGFGNKQRTSTTSGILKALAVRLFAEVLLSNSVNTFQDFAGLSDDQLNGLQKQIAGIRGQKSGIAFDYFRMLAGSDHLVKPDRMICRFVGRVLGRDVKPVEAAYLVTRAATVLRDDFPNLSPRLLDYEIWRFERRPVTQHRG